MSRAIHLPVVAAASAAVVAVGLMALGSGQAMASQVGCGDTIKVDTTLHQDLHNCPNNGIVIGAGHITLDLNGHTVDGDGKPANSCPKNEFCDIGILSSKRNRVTIRDGSVRQFLVGAFVGRAHHNRVLDVSSSQNAFFGFVVAESDRSLVRNSSGISNLAPDGDGIGLFGSHHIRVLGSTFRNNAQLGMHVVDSSHNLIKGDVFSRNHDFGALIEANRNRVARNRCIRNDTCILVAKGNRNVIVRNHAYRGVAGIAVEKGHGNLVARNVIRRTRRQGIYLGLRSPLIGGARNVVRRNRVRGGNDAFLVNKKDGHSLLVHNVAIGARDDGFDVEGRATKLAGNRALRNGDLGIEAGHRVFDGGENVARHNGDPRQCARILCR